MRSKSLLPPGSQEALIMVFRNETILEKTVHHFNKVGWGSKTNIDTMLGSLQRIHIKWNQICGLSPCLPLYFALFIFQTKLKQKIM